MRAPLAVAVEIVGAGRRIFRLSRAAGEDGVRLERPAPFDPGRPVRVRFELPDRSQTLALQARIALCDEDGEGEQGGRELQFLAPAEDARLLLRRYVAERLELPLDGIG